MQTALERAKRTLFAILTILLRLPACHWLLRGGAAARHIPVGALRSIAATRWLPKRSATLRAFHRARSSVSAALRTLHIAPHTTSVTTKTLHIRAHDDLRRVLRNRIASFSLCANTIHRHPLQPHADPPEYLCSLQRKSSKAETVNPASEKYFITDYRDYVDYVRYLAPMPDV